MIITTERNIFFTVCLFSSGRSRHLPVLQYLLVMTSKGQLTEESRILLLDTRTFFSKAHCFCYRSVFCISLSRYSHIVCRFCLTCLSCEATFFSYCRVRLLSFNLLNLSRSVKNICSNLAYVNFLSVFI